eukprot:Ihof_evm3s676 gene=Ihof_evmTU3s676
MSGDQSKCSYPRLVPRPGDRNQERKGIHFELKQLLGTTYHYILDMGWISVVLFSMFFYVFGVVFFGTAYYLCGDIAGCKGDRVSYAEGLWFSIQTQDTIGYGVLSPAGYCSNFVVTIQAWVAFSCYAILAGIVFRKSSRANFLKNSFIFSEVALISTHVEHFEADDDRGNGKYVKGSPCLVFRILNGRRSVACDPSFHLLFACRRPTCHQPDSIISDREGLVNDRNERMPEFGPGSVVFEELNYEINRQLGNIRCKQMSNPYLGLPWTIVHHIDSTSPFYGKSPEELIAMQAEVVAILDGVDESVSKGIQVRWSYTVDQIVWNAQFEPMVSIRSLGALSKPSSEDVSQNECQSPVNACTLEESFSDINLWPGKPHRRNLKYTLM